MHQQTSNIISIASSFLNAAKLQKILSSWFKGSLQFLENMPGWAKISVCNWLTVMENRDF